MFPRARGVNVEVAYQQPGHCCQICAPPVARAVPRSVVGGGGSQNPRVFTARAAACTVFSRAPPSSSSWRTRSKKLVELGEGTEQVGVRGEVGADLVAGPTGCVPGRTRP